MNFISNLELLDLSKNFDERGSLIEISKLNKINFELKRIFYIYDINPNYLRGDHAHKKCKQLLICLRGSVRVKSWDGSESCEHILNSPSSALFIPEMIWAAQEYMVKDSVLLVACDRIYDKKDYINQKSEFLKLRNIK